MTGLPIPARLNGCLARDGKGSESRSCKVGSLSVLIREIRGQTREPMCYQGLPSSGEGRRWLNADC
jgi:hypothetical protein